MSDERVIPCGLVDFVKIIKNWILLTVPYMFDIFFKTLFVPKVRRVRSPPQDFYFMYNIWQDAGNRTRVAANAARCATNELHTSLVS